MATPNKKFGKLDLDSSSSSYSKSAPQSEGDIEQQNIAHLSELEKCNYRPSEVHIQVSKRCNLQCTMCSWQTWQSNVGFMQMPLFKKIISDCKAAGIKKIVFGNAQGEPFLNPKILDMIELAVLEGFWTMVSTNGTPFNTKKIQRLAKSNINNIQFSFAGYNKSSYESVYVGGKWEKVTKNLEDIAAKIKEAKSDTSLVINGCYTNEMAEIVGPNSFIARTRAFLRSIGIYEPQSQVRIQLPHNFGGNIKALKSINSPNGISNYTRSDEPPVLCRVLKNSPGIYYDGRVTACGCLDPNGDMMIGDMNSASIMEIRQSDDFKLLLNQYTQGGITKMPLCNECDLPFLGEVEDSLHLWSKIVEDSVEHRNKPVKYLALEQQLENFIVDDFHLSIKHKKGNDFSTKKRDYQHLRTIRSNLYFRQEVCAVTITKFLFKLASAPTLFRNDRGEQAKSIAIIPSTGIALDNLEWFTEHFEKVYLGDNYKQGETHSNIKIMPVDEILKLDKYIDSYFLATDDPKIEPQYLDI